FRGTDKLSASIFFAPPRPVAKMLTGREIPPFKRNIYGESVGGPIVRNKTFFFQSFEGRRQRESDTFRATVPTSAQRATVTNPIVNKLLALVPAPNVGGDVNNLAGSASKNRDLDQVTGKIDQVIGTNDTISGTYIFQHDKRLEPTSTGAHNLPNFGDTRDARRQLLALHYTRIISPRVTNEARFGFNRVHITFVEDFKGNPADFGLSIGTTANFPDIRVAGGPNFAGVNGFPQGRGDTMFEWNDAVAWIRGSHSFKFGGEVRRFGNNNFNDTASGRIDFPSIAAFLAGQPNRATVTQGLVTPAIRVSAYNAFFQDDYKVTPRLILNLGVRYEYNGVPTEKHNRLTVFDFANTRLTQVGSGGIERVYKRDFNNFGPRFGFSYDPLGHGTTVVRGGVGLYFDQPVTNIVTGLGSNPPFAVPIVNTGAVNLASPYAF